MNAKSTNTDKSYSMTVLHILVRYGTVRYGTVHYGTVQQKSEKQIIAEHSTTQPRKAKYSKEKHNTSHQNKAQNAMQRHGSAVKKAFYREKNQYTIVHYAMNYNIICSHKDV